MLKFLLKVKHKEQSNVKNKRETLKKKNYESGLNLSEINVEPL